MAPILLFRFKNTSLNKQVISDFSWFRDLVPKLRREKEAKSISSVWRIISESFLNSFLQSEKVFVGERNW